LVLLRREKSIHPFPKRISFNILEKYLWSHIDKKIEKIVSVSRAFLFLAMALHIDSIG